MHIKALLVKNLHKFYNKHNLPWVHLLWETYYANAPPKDKMEGSFWWKAHLKLIPLFKSIANCKAGTGDTALFWTDNWQGRPMVEQYPELHSFAINEHYSVASIKESSAIIDQFHTPLSATAFQQLNELIPPLQQTGNSEEKWSYVWKLDQFSVNKMYKQLMRTSQANYLLRGLWKVASRIRNKIFF